MSGSTLPLGPLPLDAPFTSEQQVWLAGFFAGLAAAGERDTAPSRATLTVDVLYGSQTGNSESLATDFAAAARDRGLGATITALDDVPLERLGTMSHVVVVTSTYGEGDMPDNAELFWEALAADSAPRMEGLKFAILALGDSGYDDFCQAGRLLDLRFEQLGATRIHARADCDVDFEDAADAWSEGVLGRLVAEAPTGSTTTSAPGTGEERRERSRWSRKTPFPARLVANRLLSSPDSAKEIRHFEIDLGDSGIDYEAGDALAVVPRNAPALVEEVLDTLHLRNDDALRERLMAEWEIRTPSRELLATIAERSPSSIVGELLARTDREGIDTWLWGKDLVDVLRSAPDVRFTAAELEDVLRPLQHRAYSISSSPRHSADRIHLTVAAVRYGTDRIQHGVCSTFLSDHWRESDAAGIFLQPNTSFRVPDDDDAPMIMIGPGTGVAPFRGFLQERWARGAMGRNWLFFGDQHRATDFIYADELEEHTRSGLLTRLDLAFSRDQADKVYVQTLMRESGPEFYAWLEEGAHVYVCGDASRMAKDVDRALIELVCAARGRGGEDAAEYITTLKREKRYVRDVY